MIRLKALTTEVIRISMCYSFKYFTDEWNPVSQSNNYLCKADDV